MYIKNSTGFVRKTKETKFKQGDFLVNFDIVSLFTMAPVKDTLEII